MTQSMRAAPRARRPGHAFVLGSGIAGLALAEILSRNGWKLTLLESADDLGGHASRRTQDWLHTGWLYAALPYDSAMRSCHDAVAHFQAVYGAVLSPGILNLEVTESGVAYPAAGEGWFKGEYVHYLYSISAHELSPWQQLTWRHYLDWLPLRRLRKLGYPTAPIEALPPRLMRLMDRWEGRAHGHRRYRVVRSTDARIDTHRVLSALVRLLGRDAEVLTGTRCRVELRGGRTVVHLNGEEHSPDLVVMACGKELPALLREVGRPDLAARLRSVKSPIVVLRRALGLPNFIRFTPHLPDTVNHIKCPLGGDREVSTLGSYDYWPVETAADPAPFLKRVCDAVGIGMHDVAGVYFGTKTELTGQRARCYNHALERVNDNTFFAMAGKFSQFSLLVEELAGALGLRVDIGNDERGQLELTVGATAPARIARTFASARDGPAPRDTLANLGA